MYRVGKSATETEAETWESDPISVRSCARMTGCFGRTHVFITVRADRQLRATYCTSQGHSCGNEAALNKYFRVSQRAQRPGQTGEDVSQYSRPAQIIVIIPFSLHLKTFLQRAGMPSLLSMGAVSRMCTQQLLNLHVSQTL